MSELMERVLVMVTLVRTKDVGFIDSNDFVFINFLFVSSLSEIVCEIIFHSQVGRTSSEVPKAAF